jgi:hypothetical protein
MFLLKLFPAELTHLACERNPKSFFLYTVFTVVPVVAKSHQKYYIYYLLLFCIFVFVVLWFYIR